MTTLQEDRELIEATNQEGDGLLRGLMRNHLPSFIQRSFNTVDPGTPYLHNWHIDAIAEGLLACERKEIKRLIINIPPRSLKSISVTVAWPAWLLGQNPRLRVMAASYSGKLSIKHSQDTRAIMSSQWYKEAYPETLIAAGQDEKSKFMTTMRGFRYATSVGATATGEGGDILIVDDPLNPTQAASDIERETANTWFDQTFTSRLNNKQEGVIVLVMQRLHEEDLTGHLLAKESNWEHLCLPAENDRKTIIQIGDFKREWEDKELLHPTFMPQSVLENLKVEMGSFAYAGQYLQNPVPEGGGILRSSWWRLWRDQKPPPCEYVIQCYDTAFKTKEENDYTARTTWGVFMFPGRDGISRYHVILLECMAQRLTFPELRDEAMWAYKEYKPDKVMIEDKGSGISLIQELKRKGIPVRVAKVKGDKVSRAHAASSVLERGAVFYMDKPWAREVIKQCAVFPKGKHDDIVDTCMHTWEWLRNTFWLQLEDDDIEEEWGGKDPNTTKRFYG